MKLPAVFSFPAWLFLAPSAEWRVIADACAELVHPADFWAPENLTNVPSVQLAQELRRFVQVSAVGEKGRMVIIPQADRLLREAANTLLKTLEEPPPGVHLILLAEKDGVLPTIRSRVQMVVVSKGASQTPWKSVLTSYSIENPDDRQLLRDTLSLVPSVHQGIRSDTLPLFTKP